MRETDEIIAAIRSAFAGVPRGGITLHEAEVIDVYGTDAERQRARAQDDEARWEDVPDSAIEACADALPHLDPTSWRYYLPAYMIWSLRHFRTSTSTVPDATIYTLALCGSDAQLREHGLRRFRTLDEAQTDAVRRFLRFMAAEDDVVDGVVAGQALESFWSQASG